MIIDLTHPLSETIPVYPSKTRFSRKKHDLKNGVCLNDISLSSGIGTHMDAPRHFYAEGNSIDQIPLERFFGPACVLHLSEKVKDNANYSISVEDLHVWEKTHGSIPPKCLFFADTGWDRLWGKNSYCIPSESGGCPYPGFSAEAAKLLVQRKVNIVGIDTLGLDPGCNLEAPAHQILLKEEIPLIECLANLDKIPPKGAMVFALPMNIQGAPEAPVRVVAFIGKKFEDV